MISHRMARHAGLAQPAQAIASFSRETDPAVLNVKPRHLTIVALINNLQGTSTLASGDKFKRVVGGQDR
ncbi:MAG: hypothetical protein IMZ46_18365 [Acidobacteria bacterium]|nr:hypothetical protein [Acidobacteriota bacterium]